MAIRNWGLFIICMNFYLFTGAAHAGIKATDIESIQLIGEMITSWWTKMPETKPVSLSIVKVETSSNLDQNFASLVDDIFLAAFANSKNTQAIKCLECHQPQIKVKDDRLIITKGLPNQEALKELAKKLGLEAFVTVYVTKSAFFIKAFVTVQYTATGEVYSAKDFRVANVAPNDTSMQFLLGTGLQWELPVSGSFTSDSVPVAVEFSWMQAVGTHTKAGITVGGLLLAKTGTIIHIAPQIGWKIPLGKSYFALAPNIHAGLGFRIAALVDASIEDIKEDKPNIKLDVKMGHLGITGGISLDLHMGQFFFIGAKADAFMPVNFRSAREIMWYPGFHFGLLMGR